ncbi:MAG TPA: c-type cytochrome [Candidatus Binatia bacterium]|nr:c-type cytochrome [Candidatus Binatia bacterium]
MHLMRMPTLFGFAVALGAVLVGGSSCKQARLVRAETDLRLGERIYTESCAACHGPKGDGNGPQADRLKTKPRDFTRGIYKFRSTPSGALPLDGDLFRTIRTGVRGTSMLAQLQLSEKETRSVIEYIKSFSSRFKNEKAASPIAPAPKPAFTSGLISFGQLKYEEAGCAQCHGANGQGDGPSGKDLKDDWGQSISPTDLTLKPFKSGPEPEDLFRTLSTGLNGTPMPSYAEALSDKDRWALVAYIMSMATGERPRGMMGLVGEEIDGMRIDMRAAMAGMMGGGGMMGRGGGMMHRDMRDMMNDMMRR